jgi:hypothetical protein
MFFIPHLPAHVHERGVVPGHQPGVELVAPHLVAEDRDQAGKDEDRQNQEAKSR